MRSFLSKEGAWVDFVFFFLCTCILLLMSSKRLFLAIPLSDQWKRYIQDWVITQPNYFPWIPPDYWHITVQYIGEVSEDDIPAMVDEIRTIAATQPEFFLHFMNICVFRFHEPPMIWAKVKESDPFEELVKHCTQTTDLYMQGIPDRRKSKPHITLAKLAGEYDCTRLKFPDSRPPFAMMHVREIELWESYIDTDKRRKYRSLEKFGLKSN